MIELYDLYLKKITETHLSGDTTELSFYPALKEFLENYAADKGHKISVTVNPSKTDSGMPDFLIKTKKGKIVGYIEAKDITEKDLDKISETDQLKRYKEGLPNLILTNFFDFYFFRDEKLQQIANIADSNRLIVSRKEPLVKNIEEFETLLEKFFSFSIPRAYNAKKLAEELAKRTKLLAGTILKELENENHNLLSLYEVFKDELIKSASMEDFADLYAQTLTYGLFFARTQSTEEEFSRITAYEYIPGNIPLLQRLFYLLTGPSNLPESLLWILDDIVNVLSSCDLSSIMKEFHTKMWTEDPVIHFYETFLKEYNPKKRERKGVYFTPSPVVSYIISSINHILKEKFSISNGLADKNVTLLDPAAGTLTFLTTAIRLIKEEYVKKGKSGVFSSLVKNHFLKDFYAFELLLAPYAIGHFKANIVLEDLGYKLDKHERLQFYLTNTLEMKELGQSEFFPVLAEEGEKAKEIKEKIPILVICGNPPYHGESENKGEWITGLIEDYKYIDGQPLGEKNPKWLQNDYVKFIRFSQWKLDQYGEGVHGFITDHSYLDSPTFRGMRHHLLSSFDEIYILDLHGDARRREKCSNGSLDQNVFDIQQGVCISFFIKKKGSNSNENCKVFHSDLIGTEKTKLEWLSAHNIKTTKWKRIRPHSPDYFFAPRREKHKKVYDKYWEINQIFPISSVGIVTARDRLTIKDTSNELWKTVNDFSKLPEEQAREKYNLGKDARDWKVSLAQQDLITPGLTKKSIVPILYRPFDIKYTYYTGHSRGFICMPRANIMQHMMKENLSMCVGRAGKVVGVDKLWNIVFCSELIEDFNLFYRGGNVNFPLHLYDNQSKKSNINPTLYKNLKESYGKEPSPEEIFYYTYAILHSNNYRLKFNEFLMDKFPKIPFTRNYKLFKKIADFGKTLVELHILKSPLLQKLQATYNMKGDDIVKIRKYDEKQNRIYINKNQYFGNIPEELWDFYIGGYQILDKWLKDRKKKKLSFDEIETYCKIVSSIKHTIKAMDKIDNLYDGVEQDIIEYEEINQNHKLMDFGD